MALVREPGLSCDNLQGFLRMRHQFRGVFQAIVHQEFVWRRAKLFLEFSGKMIGAHIQRRRHLRQGYVARGVFMDEI